jgi:hypothetical protein
MLSFVCALFTVSCSSHKNEPPPIPERSNADVVPRVRRAITQVRQTLNLDPQQTMRVTLQALSSRNVNVSSVDETQGIIETDWVPMKDSVCSGRRNHNAPLDCRARLSFKIEALPVTASILHIRYREFCSFNEELTLECPESSAEKLMISVLEEVKAVDAAQ